MAFMPKLNIDTAAELWPVHQLFGLRWTPKWNTICNSPAISAHTIRPKQIQWLSDKQIQMVQHTQCSVNNCMTDSHLSGCAAFQKRLPLLK